MVGHVAGDPFLNRPKRRQNKVVVTKQKMHVLLLIVLQDYTVINSLQYLNLYVCFDVQVGALMSRLKVREPHGPARHQRDYFNHVNLTYAPVKLL